MTILKHVTRSLARISAPLIERTLTYLSHRRRIVELIKNRETKRLNRIRQLNRFLIIPGIHIGDTIIDQVFIPPFKHLFPDIEVSYVYQKKVYPLIHANPNIDKHYPFFENLSYPSSRDSANLKSLIKENNFNFIVNFCPYLPHTIFKGSQIPFISLLRVIANILRDHSSDSQKAHLVYQLEKYGQEVAGEIAAILGIEAQTPASDLGLRLYLEPRVWEETQRAMNKLNLDPNSKKIFYNPDTGSRYTLMPFEFQTELLRGILSDPRATILLNCGHTFKNIEKQLMEDLPHDLRKRVVLISKDIPLDIFSGMIDMCDMAVTGDTAPLHIAAAEKLTVGSDNKFRNSTAIVGIFGAGSAKVYGYDSFSNQHLPARQDAPSKTFEGSPRCKNITCLDKPLKNCRKIRCFEPLKARDVIDYILDYLSSLP